MVTATQTLVLVDLDQRKAVPIPDSYRETIRAFEGETLEACPRPPCRAHAPAIERPLTLRGRAHDVGVAAAAAPRTAGLLG